MTATIIPFPDVEETEQTRNGTNGPGSHLLRYRLGQITDPIKSPIATANRWMQSRRGIRPHYHQNRDSGWVSGRAVESSSCWLGITSKCVSGVRRLAYPVTDSAC